MLAEKKEEGKFIGILGKMKYQLIFVCTGRTNLLLFKRYCDRLIAVL
jgi:hypothetical protein